MVQLSNALYRSINTTLVADHRNVRQYRREQNSRLLKKNFNIINKVKRITTLTSVKIRTCISPTFWLYIFYKNFNIGNYLYITLFSRRPKNVARSLDKTRYVGFINDGTFVKYATEISTSTRLILCILIFLYST